jgi:hypothetical protein
LLTLFLPLDSPTTRAKLENLNSL